MAQPLNESWNLVTEPIDTTNKNISWKEAAKFTDERVEAFGKINELIKSQEQAFISKERENLEASLRNFESFSVDYHNFLRNEEQAIAEFKAEIAKHKPEQETNTGNLNQAQSEKAQVEIQLQTADHEMRNLAHKRKEIVTGINAAELSAIKFKDHLDPSNDVFKWVLEAVYGDSKTNYYWDNFKKNAFKKDKGADFMLRLKGVSVPKMKKETFSFAASVYQRKEEILADLEPKKKQNPSLRNLLEYIGNIVQVGKFIDESEQNKILLAKKQSEIEHHDSVLARSSLVVRSLEEKLKVSTHYVDTLKKQRQLFDHLNDIIGNRIQVQEQYLHTLQGGDIQALNNLAQSTSKPRTQTLTQTSDQQNVQETQGDYPTQKRPVEPNDVESPDWKESPVKDRVIVQEEEKAFFGSEQKVKAQPQRSVNNANLTDIGESELAKNEKGSCQNCSIF